MLISRMAQAFAALATTLTVLLAGTAEAGTAARGQENRPQLLFFNHAYGVLDRVTADAVEHSAYLREFAHFQVRTTTGTGGVTWKGRYLFGRETYFELFGVGDLPDTGYGSAGMAVSVERAGGLATVVEGMRDQGVADPVQFLQTRDFGDGVPVPWFDAVYATDEIDAFLGWGMEYRAEYFADPRGNTEPPAYPGDVGRERYLPDLYRDRLMRDVTGVRIAITSGDLADTVPLLRAGGFTVRPLPNGGVVALRGGTKMRLDVVPRDQVGLRRIDMSLNRSVSSRHEERIGRSTLAVGPGPRAVWTFPDVE
ncbi:DUF5829 family protein [Spirillospora sp. NPDC029432]|uniref:DUF5829 family protein n=1 Tax=Spirillospora sp. NPDC029432 TaxID=3154599 RepID=UPI003453D4CE